MIAINATDAGNIVRHRRTRAGLTQAVLASRVGVSRKWLADLEKGFPRAELRLVPDTLSALDALVNTIDAPSAKAQLEKGSPKEMPSTGMPAQIVEALERVGAQDGLPAGAEETLEGATQLMIVNADQMASIRSAVADIQLEECARRVMREV